MYKTHLISLLSIALFTLNINGQVHIIFSFGSSSNLDSVRIENIQNESFQVITGNSYEVVIDPPLQLEPDRASNEAFSYPNPFSHKTNIKLHSDHSGTAHISVFDLSGRRVAGLSQEVDKGSNQFIFRPDHPGIFILYTVYNSSTHTDKLICTEASSSQPIIEYNGSADAHAFVQNHLKSASNIGADGFKAEMGDLLKFTAYSGNKADSKYDFLSRDRYYEFNFHDRYYSFTNHFIQGRVPGLVDIVFSITNEANEGIDYLSSDDFMVTEEGRVNSPLETFQSIRKSTETPNQIKTVLLLDNSSKLDSYLAALKNSATKLVQAMVENQEMALCVYSDSSVLMRDFTERQIILDYWISKIKIDSGNSDLLNALIKPLNLWQDKYMPSAVSQGSLIVFSGGCDSPEAFIPEDVLSALGHKRVYAITLNGDTDSILLSKIASPGHYYSIQDMNALDQVFASIQKDIVRYSNSFYCLNYMSDKRGGEQNTEVSILDNTNSGPSGYFSGSYNADGFVSATPGVYLNPTDTALYGLDTIRCFVNRPHYIFASDAHGEIPYSIDTLILHAVTYGAAELPEYTWELSEDEAFKIEALPLVEAALIPISMARDTVTITLRDIANNFSKEIVFIMDPPEFFENMGIVLSQIKDGRLDEISGMAASARYPGYFWVHNDSGDDAYVYLINTDGYTLARVFIEDITSRDWEDIAVGPGPAEGENYIYIADIGDLDKEYHYKYIYRLAEPDIDTMVLNQNYRVKRDSVACYTYKYADGLRDAEILLIDPLTKDLFVVTKREENVQIYTLPYPQVDADTLILTKSSVTLPFRMTNGGDISADGNEILIKNLTRVYYWIRLPGETIIETLARGAMSLPYVQEPQGESIAWLRDGSGYLTVSEEKDNIKPLLYLYKR